MSTSDLKHSQIVALRHKCAVLRNEGYKNKQIQTKLQVSKKFVTRWWKRDDTDMDNFQDAPRTGRKRKLTTESKTIITTSIGKRHRSSRKISKYLSANKIQKVSHTTVLKEFRRLGAKPYVRQKIPRKCRNWRPRRLNFCEEYGGKTDYFWCNKVIFSDETFFGLNQRYNRHNDIIWVTDGLLNDPKVQNLL